MNQHGYQVSASMMSVHWTLWPKKSCTWSTERGGPTGKKGRDSLSGSV